MTMTLDSDLIAYGCCYVRVHIVPMVLSLFVGVMLVVRCDALRCVAMRCDALH